MSTSAFAQTPQPLRWDGRHRGAHGPAGALFNRAIARDPNNVAARQWLVILAKQRNDHDEARGRCCEIQRLSPGLRSMNECIARSLAAR